MREKRMNIARNMEAVFIVAIALTGIAAVATKPATPRITPQVTSAENMIVVTHVGKRLTAAEKASFDAQS